MAGKKRAPHGAPEFTERMAMYCTAAQKRKFDTHGGSAWLRRVLDKTTEPPVEPEAASGKRGRR